MKGTDSHPLEHGTKCLSTSLCSKRCWLWLPGPVPSAEGSQPRNKRSAALAMPRCPAPAPQTQTRAAMPTSWPPLLPSWGPWPVPSPPPSSRARLSSSVYTTLQGCPRLPAVYPVTPTPPDLQRPPRSAVTTSHKPGQTWSPSQHQCSAPHQDVLSTCLSRWLCHPGVSEPACLPRDPAGPCPTCRSLLTASASPALLWVLSATASDLLK